MISPESVRLFTTGLWRTSESVGLASRAYRLWLLPGLGKHGMRNGTEYGTEYGMEYEMNAWTISACACVGSDL